MLITNYVVIVLAISNVILIIWNFLSPRKPVKIKLPPIPPLSVLKDQPHGMSLYRAAMRAAGGDQKKAQEILNNDWSKEPWISETEWARDQQNEFNNDK